MYRAAIILTDFSSSPPTAKDIKNYFKNSTTLLYGNEKRKNKNFPLCEKMYTVESAYATFQSKIFDEETTTYYSKTLYVFDDRVNSTHFLLNYSNFKVLRFELDLSIIDEMHHRKWEYDHLTRYKKNLENSVATQNFFIEKNIGDPSFYKSFPKFKKSALEYAAKVDKAITKIEEKAIALFKSEW